MSLLTPLVAFELRQAVPTPDADVAAFAAPRLAQPGGPLPAALAYAAARTWRGLAVALAPAPQLKSACAEGAGDAAWVEEQLRRFAQQTTRRFVGLADGDRTACLAECRRLARDESPEALCGGELARGAAAHTRHDDTAALTAAAVRAEASVADALAASFPRFSRLLRDQPAGPPLLAATFAYFLRREIEANEELASELMCDGLRRLSAPLAGPLAGLAQALGRLGSRFDDWVARMLDAVPPGRRPDAVPDPLAARPTPFVALRGGRKAPSRVRAGSQAGGRSSAVLVSRPAALAGAARPGPSYVNSLGMPFVWVPPGEFVMGSPATEAMRDDDERQRRVKITRGFFIGAFSVTRGQFASFARAAKYTTEAEHQGGTHRGPSGQWKLDPVCSWKRPDFPQDDDHPAVCVSWNDAQAFCAWLAAVEGHKGGLYRLPTEAEWEYACRAGTTTTFWPGDALPTDQANYNGQAGANGRGLFRGTTTPVWVFPPNPWGLYDVHGNVWEWCSDWYGPYPAGDATDPQGPPSGKQRVLRGGSWRCQLRFLRSAARNPLAPSGRDRDAGFRVCLVV